MKIMDLIARIGSRVYWREAAVAKHFFAHIKKDDMVLDVGAGSGKLAQVLIDKREAKLRLLDVVDHNNTSLPLQLYDGKRIPFDDNSFDVCLVVFVLHHADNADELIREVVRVSKRKIVVVEDTPANAFERLMWSKWDYFLNHAHHDDIAVAHKSRSPEEWRKFFGSHGLKVVAERSFRTLIPVLRTYRHTAYVLEK